MPEFVALAERSDDRIHHCHQCQYCCPWQKATTFMTGGGCQYAPQLEKRCTPIKRRFCSRTGLPHFTLDNPSVTKQAQTYSKQLASELAQTFREAWDYNYLSVVSIASGKVLSHD